MTRVLLAAAAALVMSAPLAAAGLAYPKTDTVQQTDTLHGVSVADPYRWLEDDVRTNPKVAAWVAEQNKLSSAYLAGLPQRDQIKARLTELWNYERYGVPRERAGRLFYSRNSGLQNQSVLYVKDGGGERVLIDPNPWAKDGATALAEWQPSGDGRLLAYTVQDGGTDWRTIKVRDVATGKDLPDTIEWAKYTSVVWGKDGKTLFYSRFDAPAPGEKYQSTTLNQHLMMHRLGTPQSADTLLYATPDHPKRGHSPDVTDDGRWLVITTSEGTDNRYEVVVADLTKSEKPRVLIRGLDYDWQLAGSRGQTLYFVTNKDAPRGRLVAVDAISGKLTEIVPQGHDTIDHAALIGDRFVIDMLADAKSRVLVYALDGKPAGEVPLPGIGTATGFESSLEPKAYFTFSSYATPGTVWSYDTRTGKADRLAAPKVAFKPDDYVVSQVFYASKDGAKIPMFLAHRRDLDLGKPHPTMLYGYGGFNVSLTPAYSASVLQWMEMGGVYAVANLRGGGEYGLPWHDAGRLANKQNVFDDFIAAGETLVAKGITTPKQLAVIGRSNGGLLIGAVVNQRPDLFGVALPGVGVMDMLRFNRFTAGRFWTDDYGDPADPAAFKTLYAYSPYHNIKGGRAYPPILVTTADTDDRVVPGHSFKYTAALQAADIGDKPHIVRIETRAGHGSGKPTDKIIAETADVWAFAAYWTGLTK